MFLIIFSKGKTVELPILIAYEESLMNLNDQNLTEKIRILDIDGTYLVSLWNLEKATNIFKSYKEIAFSSLWEAEEYLRDELGIDFPSDEEKEKDLYFYDTYD